MAISFSNVVQFPQSALQYVPQEIYNQDLAEDMPILGGILSDINYAWHTKGPCLEVRNVNTGRKVGSWTFGCILKDSNTKVVAVDEIRRPHGRLGLLAVGIDCTISGGLICVFDIFGSKVLRAIQIKEKIISLQVVDSGCEPSSLPEPGPLKYFDGVIAVGTRGGNVFLVDLCRQIFEEALQNIDSSVVRDELCPCQVLNISVKDVPKIRKYVEQSVKNEEHLVLHLNVVLNKSTEHFTLKGQDGKDRIHVNYNEAEVSALYYCPQLACLLVGYNFGAFQIWDLQNVNLIYTSPVLEDHLPVTCFAIQEPADDPKAYCYIWVSYSNTKLYQAGLPFAVMYSLYFNRKINVKNYGVLYQDFQYSSVRFQIELDAIEGHRCGSKPKGGHCIGLQSITKHPTNKDLNSLALCLISWNVWFGKSDTQTCYLLFDLNQWYKEQMPSKPNWDDCSNYIIKHSLSDSPLLDITVDKKTIIQFIGIQRLEEHFCPTALSFDVWCLGEKKVFKCQNRGLQRTLLMQIESAGSLCLLRPNEIYQQVISLGLTPLFCDISANMPISTDLQRDIILNSALEHKLLAWLCRCASELANGSFSSAGCTLNALVDWAFQRGITLKMNSDKYCTCLFDFSGSRLDNNTSMLLNSCTRQIKNLSTFFGYLIRKLPNYIPNKELVSEQHKCLQNVSIYFEVILWLVNIGLLPECHPSTYPKPDENERISAPYLVHELTEYYNQKRAHLKQLSNESIASSDSLLFIDNLITIKCGAETLQKQWQEDGGSGLYPPPSLQSILRTYLIQNSEIIHKHSLVIYLFLDLTMVLDQNKYSEVIKLLLKFPQIFGISLSTIKLTQGFWHLDHGDFETGLENVLDPMVLEEDLQQWHHGVVMRSLLLQKQHNLALYYMQVKKPAIVDEKDILTAISLFVSNNMLDEAFYFQKQHQTLLNEHTLLAHLFNECNKNETLHLLLYKCLNTDEEKAFFKYLRTVQNPKADDLQVFYYLLRSRFVEAFDTHQNSKRQKPEPQGLAGQRNSTATDHIVKIFKSLLPDVNRNFVETIRKEKMNLWKEVKRPSPLSVFVHNAKEQVQYKSTVIYAALAKAKQTFNDTLNVSTFKDLNTEETPFLRTPKAYTTHSRRATPVINPKVIELDESGEELGPSPAKKLKLTPRQSTSSPVWNKSITVQSKMDTPIVRRKISSQMDDSLQSTKTFNVCTPQSILKVRNLVRETAGEGSALNDTFDYPDLMPVEESTKKSRLGLSPRRPVSRSSYRQHVKFDDLHYTSSFSDQSVRQSFENKFANESATSSSSKNNSSSMNDDLFYSPNTSLNYSKEENIPESNVESLRKTKTTPQNANAKLVDKEETKVDEHEITKEELGVPTEANMDYYVDKEEEIIKEGSATTEERSSSSPMQSPKARRSYKRNLFENVPIRSSPRLSRTSTPEKPKVTTPIEDTSFEQKPTSTQSPARLQGRKSLSRQVLENNALQKILSAPKTDNLITKEVSYSKTETTTVTEKSRNSSATISSETKLETSSTFTMDPETPVKHYEHLTTSTSESKKNLLDFDSNSDSEGSIASESGEPVMPELPDKLKELLSKPISQTLDEMREARWIKSHSRSPNDSPFKGLNMGPSEDMLVRSQPNFKLSDSSFVSSSRSSSESDFVFKKEVRTSAEVHVEPQEIEAEPEQKNEIDTNSVEEKEHLDENIFGTLEYNDEELNESIVDVVQNSKERMEIYEDLSSGSEDIAEVLSQQQVKTSTTYTDLKTYRGSFDELEENVFQNSSHESLEDLEGNSIDSNLSDQKKKGKKSKVDEENDVIEIGSSSEDDNSNSSVPSTTFSRSTVKNSSGGELEDESRSSHDSDATSDRGKSESDEDFEELRFEYEEQEKENDEKCEDNVEMNEARKDAENDSDKEANNFRLEVDTDENEDPNDNIEIEGRREEGLNVDDERVTSSEQEENLQEKQGRIENEEKAIEEIDKNSKELATKIHNQNTEVIETRKEEDLEAKTCAVTDIPIEDDKETKARSSESIQADENLKQVAVECQTDDNIVQEHDGKEETEHKEEKANEIKVKVLKSSKGTMVTPKLIPNPESAQPSPELFVKSVKKTYSKYDTPELCVKNVRRTYLKGHITNKDDTQSQTDKEMEIDEDAFSKDEDSSSTPVGVTESVVDTPKLRVRTIKKTYVKRLASRNMTNDEVSQSTVEEDLENADQAQMLDEIEKLEKTEESKEIVETPELPKKTAKRPLLRRMKKNSTLSKDVTGEDGQNNGDVKKPDEAKKNGKSDNPNKSEETEQSKEVPYLKPKAIFKILSEEAASFSSESTEDTPSKQIVTVAQVHAGPQKDTPTRRVTRRRSYLDNTVNSYLDDTATDPVVPKLYCPDIVEWTPELPKTNKEKHPSKRTRSLSVDQVTKPITRNLRSNSVDEMPLEEKEEKVKGKRGRPPSVRKLTPINEENRPRRKAASDVEAYTTTRRLTRKQSSMLKDVQEGLNVLITDSLDAEVIDRIKLFEKSPFSGKPDPEEEKVYETSPSNSSISSRPTRRQSRSASVVSDSSRPPSVNEVSTPIKRRISGNLVTAVDSPSGIKSRLRSQSTEVVPEASEQPSTPSPPKRQKKGNDSDVDDAASVSSVARSTRSRASSVSSAKTNKSNVTDASKKGKRGRPRLNASSLPQISEEKSEEAGSSKESSVRKGKPIKKSK